MSEDTAKPTREERLAAKLRENLRRRKAQSREMEHKLEQGAEPRNQQQDGTLPKAPEDG